MSGEPTVCLCDGKPGPHGYGEPGCLDAAHPAGPTEEPVTGLRARLAERLDEIEAGPVLTVVALFIAGFIGALVWGGDRVVDVVLGVGIAWLIWNVGLLHSRTDEALDEADKAHKRVEAVEGYLTGLESPGSGKHARSAVTGGRKMAA